MTASVSNWVGLASLVLLAACGGRTSTLTDDNDPTLGSSVPGDNAGGGAAGSTTAPGPTSTPSGSPTGPGMMVGGGGVTGIGGVAGGTSSGGVTGVGGSPAITPACQDFCKNVQSSPCAGDLGIPAGSCTNDCTRSLGTDACAPSAKAVLDCYSQVFAANGSHCAVLGDQLERKCRKQAYAFERCSEGTQPSPPVSPACSGSGSGSSTSCSLSSKCDDGSFYVVSCNETPAGQAQCNCLSAAGMSVQVTLNESASNACFDAAASCGVQDLGIPPPK